MIDDEIDDEIIILWLSFKEKGFVQLLLFQVFTSSSYNVLLSELLSLHLLKNTD